MIIAVGVSWLDPNPKRCISNLQNKNGLKSFLFDYWLHEFSHQRFNNNQTERNSGLSFNFLVSFSPISELHIEEVTHQNLILEPVDGTNVSFLS